MKNSESKSDLVNSFTAWLSGIGLDFDRAVSDSKTILIRPFFALGKKIAGLWLRWQKDTIKKPIQNTQVYPLKKKNDLIIF